MPDAWPPQPDVFRESRPLQFRQDKWTYLWSSDHEWTVARVHASWHGRRHPEDGDLAFARAVLAELH